MTDISHQAQYTLSELAKSFTNDFEVSIQGDPDCVIRGISTIQNAKPEHITFLINPVYKKYLPTTQAAAVILTASEASECPVNALITCHPYYTYAKIAALFNPKPLPEPGIHVSAVVGKHCEIDPSAAVAAHCVIGEGVKLAQDVVVGPGCVIGPYCELAAGTRLEANVTLYDRIVIGKRVLIASGTVIGSDGFGIAKHKGAWHKVPQIGRVVIGDDVDIGANCAIDRGAIEDTVIENGVKLDNLIQIGHNVRIGANTAIAGCVGIAGSAVIGKNCLIGGASGINGHITIADNTVITGMSVISKSIREPGVYSSGVGGQMTNLEWRKNSARLHRVDQLTTRVKNLEATLKKLTEEKVK